MVSCGFMWFHICFISRVCCLPINPHSKMGSTSPQPFNYFIFYLFIAVQVLPRPAPAGVPAARPNNEQATCRRPRTTRTTGHRATYRHFYGLHVGMPHLHPNFQNHGHKQQIPDWSSNKANGASVGTVHRSHRRCSLDPQSSVWNDFYCRTLIGRQDARTLLYNIKCSVMAS